MYVQGAALLSGAPPPNAHHEPEIGMRARPKVTASLEGVYRKAFEKAGETGDRARMDALDFGFQRDQVMLEVLLDVRDLLGELRKGAGRYEPSLLDTARAIRRFTRPGTR